MNESRQQYHSQPSSLSPLSNSKVILTDDTSANENVDELDVVATATSNV